jgi:uncharacterized protein
LIADTAHRGSLSASLFSGSRRCFVRAAGISVLLLVGCAFAAEPLAVPAFKPVTDLTGTLEKDHITQLESAIAAFEQRKGSQIAVLMVPSTAPETIEQFSLRVAETWKIGRKGADDGVLLTIARNDRTLRIETGYGLEGALNDATARRIIDEIMAPALREGNYFGATQAGVQKIMQVIDGESLPPPAAAVSDGHGISPDDFPFYFLTILGVIFTGLFVRKRFGRLLTGTVCALVAGGMTWHFTEAIIATGGMMFIVLVGVALADGGSGGGSGSSRGSSSRSSGGGGSFGGGGSSGRW